MDTIAVLVLAAGKSSRMKSIKQLTKINDKTLLEITLDKAKQIAPNNTFCILGANADKIKSQINFNGIHIIINKNFEKGLSSSIIKGVQTITKEHLKLKNILILLADQPAIELSYLKEMIVIFEQNPTKIIASKYQNTYGVPALIPSIYFDSLLQIKGDKGAKVFLNSNQLSILSPKKNTNLVDIDTKDQLKQFINN
ncbi:nucleotidyltransferase family protein [Polaribacter sp. M15]